MKIFRLALLVTAASLSLLFLIGYFRAIAPMLDLRDLSDSDVFDVFGYSDVALLRFWDHGREEFGPLTVQLFKVADYPTGYATVRYWFPSCYLALLAAGFLIYAIYRVSGIFRRAALQRSNSLELRKLLARKE